MFVGRKKLSLLRIPRGFSVETALISLYGADSAVKKENYFTHMITLDNLF